MSQKMMRWQPAALLLAGLAMGLLAPSAARAQLGPPGAVEQFQLWNQFQVIKTVAPGVRGVMEVWPRFRTRPNFALDRLFLRPWAAFRVNESNSIWLGAAAILNNTAAGNRTETRFLQQHVGAYPMGDWIFSTRFRVEERLLPNVPSLSIRVRGRVGFEIPLDERGDWNLILNDEVFINANDAGAVGLRDGLTENRAILGFKTRVARGVGIEFGYQHNWVNRDTTPDDIKHTALLNFSFDLDEMAGPQRRAEAESEGKVAEVPAQPKASEQTPAPAETGSASKTGDAEPTIAQLAAESQAGAAELAQAPMGIQLPELVAVQPSPEAELPPVTVVENRPPQQRKRRVIDSLDTGNFMDGDADEAEAEFELP